jgi:glucose-1-phosphatase
VAILLSTTWKTGPVTLLFAFDMDEVIYDYDWRRRMAGLSALTGLPVDELRARWWTHPEGEKKAEAGGWRTGDEYLAAVNSTLGIDVPADAWLAARRDAMAPRPAVIAAIERAKQLGEVTMLTNNGAFIGENLRRLVPEVAELFGDGLRATAHYGARKPDPAVFRSLLAAYDRSPAEVFFTDDLRENIAGAASVGITAHLFEGAEGLLAAIEDFAATSVERISAARS